MIGGLVTWLTPADVSQVTFYNIYLANSSSGESRSQIGASISEGFNEISIGVSTSLQAFAYIVVFTQSRMFEQTTPAFTNIEDTVVVAQSLAFADLDLDVGQIGGYVQWFNSAPPAQMTHWDVYLSESSSGSGLSQIGNSVPVGTNQILLPDNTVKGVFEFVFLRARSSL